MSDPFSHRRLQILDLNYEFREVLDWINLLVNVREAEENNRDSEEGVEEVPSKSYRLFIKKWIKYISEGTDLTSVGECQLRNDFAINIWQMLAYKKFHAPFNAEPPFGTRLNEELLGDFPRFYEADKEAPNMEFLIGTSAGSSTVMIGAFCHMVVNCRIPK